MLGRTRPSAVEDDVTGLERSGGREDQRPQNQNTQSLPDAPTSSITPFSPRRRSSRGCTSLRPGTVPRLVETSIGFELHHQPGEREQPGARGIQIAGQIGEQRRL